MADETYVSVPPAVLVSRLVAPPLLADWFPELTFTVFMDRGAKGTRWSVTGALVGSAEVWLEEFSCGPEHGSVVHWFLRGDPTARGSTTQPWSGDPDRLARRSRRIARDYTRRIKRRMFALKDEAESVPSRSV